MSRHILITATILFLSLGAFKPAQAQKKRQKQSSTTSVKKDGVNFLDDITIQASSDQNNASDPKAIFAQSIFKDEKKAIVP